MPHYEIWTAPDPGEHALRHEYARHGEVLDDVIAEARRLARTEPWVLVVEVSDEGDHRVTVLWEAERDMEGRALTCKRCGHAWIPRTTRPLRCPACNSPYWDRDRARAPSESDQDAEGVRPDPFDRKAEPKPTMLICPRCRHAWFPRTTKPLRCPICQAKLNYSNKEED